MLTSDSELLSELDITAAWAASFARVRVRVGLAVTPAACVGTVFPMLVFRLMLVFAYVIMGFTFMLILLVEEFGI